MHVLITPLIADYPLIASDCVCVARLHAALGLSGLALTYSMTLTALAKYALPLDCALIAS